MPLKHGGPLWLPVAVTVRSAAACRWLLPFTCTTHKGKYPALALVRNGSYNLRLCGLSGSLAALLRPCGLDLAPERAQLLPISAAQPVALMISRRSAAASGVALAASGLSGSLAALLLSIRPAI